MPENQHLLTESLAVASSHKYPFGRKIRGLASSTLDKLLLLHAIRECYQRIPPCRDAFEFVEKALEILEIDYSPLKGDRGSIPHSGPLIVVANHPFGGVDGLVLTNLLSQVRKDIRILANLYLGAVPEICPILYLVDPFGKKASTKRNIASLSKAVRWVRGGGVLLTFPAGEVSHFSITRRHIADPDWRDTTGRLVHLTKPPVLPVYFRGGNSTLFHIAGLVHPRLRTAMLPRELLKKRCTSVQLKIGQVIPYKRLVAMEDPSVLTSYLRFRTDLLQKSFVKAGKILRFPQKPQNLLRPKAFLVPPGDGAALSGEVMALPREQKLAQSGPLCVYWAHAQQIPRVLHEIGRLREETFRATGEGTGRSIDLDRFDQTYLHLFLWNEENDEIAGAYRLGRTDEILTQQNPKGLYTQTLFNYQPSFLEEMGPTLEMGRTFVRSHYQRSYSALLLLWKGIGQYVAGNPRYRILFGAVSISKNYQSYSRQVMVTFLKMNHFIPHLSKKIKPRRPYRKRLLGSKGKTVRLWGRDLEEVSSWISGIEGDGKGVPILLKQYLKMGGKILCFNVDPDFGDVLDGLILVDLLASEEKMLIRYMGELGLMRFRAYHCQEGSYPVGFLREAHR